ncbi:MAG: hypothetical protein CHACPFDD_02059 [Phycisphaerae bacterium]|nr:hypothetical protein [Phycisphaerae bacterium]
MRAKAGMSGTAWRAGGSGVMSSMVESTLGRGQKAAGGSLAIVRTAASVWTMTEAGPYSASPA